MAYIPLPRREPSGFYDPSMAGPNWSQGIAKLLGDLHQRREEKRSREKEEQDRMMAERKQADVEAGTEAYAKDVETRRRQQESPQPSAAERFFNTKHKVAQELFPNDPKKAYAWAVEKVQLLYPPGTGGAPKKTTGTGAWITKTEDRFIAERKRLRSVGEDLGQARNEANEKLTQLIKTGAGVSEDQETRKAHRAVQEINDRVVENDSAMKNLLQAIEYLPQIRNAYEQNGQVATSQMMQAITDISSNMEAIKRGGFFDQQQPGMGGQQRQPSMGGRQPQPELEIHPFIKRFLDENPNAMTDPALQQELAAIQQIINQMQPQKR